MTVCLDFDLETFRAAVINFGQVLKYLLVFNVHIMYNVCFDGHHVTSRRIQDGKPITKSPFMRRTPLKTYPHYISRLQVRTFNYNVI